MQNQFNKQMKRKLNYSYFLYMYHIIETEMEETER